MMRVDRDEAGADGLIAQCLSSLLSALEVTSALLARHPERASSVEDLSRCVEYAQQVQATGIPRYPGPLPKLEGWPTEEDVQRREKRVAFNADLAARLELSLCVFGTFVSLVVRDLGSRPEIRSTRTVERCPRRGSLRTPIRHVSFRPRRRRR